MIISVFCHDTLHFLINCDTTVAVLFSKDFPYFRQLVVTFSTLSKAGVQVRFSVTTRQMVI